VTTKSGLVLDVGHLVFVVGTLVSIYVPKAISIVVVLIFAFFELLLLRATGWLSLQ